MKIPAFRRGVVEGFYGRPWSGEQRRRLLGWMGQWGLNSYLYAPKDDPNHRIRWRECYRQAELRELSRLIRRSRQCGVIFTYGIGPGLDLRFSSASDASALRRRIGQLRSIGCRSFALLFDDIPLSLTTADRKRFGTPARAQAAMVNGVRRCLEGPEELLFCPTVYCGRMAGGPVSDSDYLREIGEHLDRSVEVFWTGPEIVSDQITIAGIRELKGVLRRKPLIWDNLHANDYDLRRIYVGPYSGRPPALRQELAGILTNPNCEFEANYVPIRTLAEYARARGVWRPRRAYRTALRQWQGAWKTHGKRKMTLEHLELLGDCLYLPHSHGPKARHWADDFGVLIERPPEDWGRCEKRFFEACSRLQELYEIMVTMQNRDLLHTFYRFIWELKEEAALLRRYATFKKAHPSATAGFVSGDHRPGVYRGGLVAKLQGLLPMNEQGAFSPRPALSSNPSQQTHS